MIHIRAHVDTHTHTHACAHTSVDSHRDILNFSNFSDMMLLVEGRTVYVYIYVYISNMYLLLIVILNRYNYFTASV